MKPVRLPGTGKKPSKYRNVACYEDGYRFDSKRERDCFRWLKTLRRDGIVDYFLRQVPIHIAPPGNHKTTATTLRIDFLVFYHDERVRYIDAKGKATKGWLDKAAVAENLYGIHIEVW